MDNYDKIQISRNNTALVNKIRSAKILNESSYRAAIAKLADDW